MNSLTQKHTQRGFTIVEIIIALLIICIMTLVLVPIYTSHADKARLAACDADLQHIADAETEFCVETGSYVRIFALDDMSFGDGIGCGATNDLRDGITDEGITTGTTPLNHIFKTKTNASDTYTTLYISPATGGIDTSAGYVLTQKFATSSSAWGGPYYNVRNDDKTVTQGWDTANLPTGSTDVTADLPSFLNRHLKGIPNDPWGNDYLFFTKAGLVLEPEGSVVSDITFNVAGISRQYNCKVFDRPTVLSLGPNGLPGDGATLPSTPVTAIPASGLTAGDFGQGDDRTRPFER